MSSAPGVAGALLPRPLDPAGAVYRICCVCTGNICRSPLAEVLLRSRLEDAGLGDRVVVDSAGISDEEAGRPAHPGTRRTLATIDLDADSHRARRFDPTWVTRYDLVLAMDSGHARALARYAHRHGTDPSRVLLVGDLAPEPSGDVPDPWGRDDDAFADVLARLEPPVEAVVAALTDLFGSPAR